MTNRIWISTIVENTATKEGLLAEHGLSFFIRTNSDTILFDTGQGDALENNAGLLNADLDNIDTVVLSHGHYDHTGGLETVLLKNSEIKIIVHPMALVERYVKDPDGKRREIGIPGHCRETLKQMEKNIVYSEAPSFVANGIYVTGAIPRITDFEDTGGRFYIDEACSFPDPILDDQAMFFDTPYGLVVILGCAHSGIVNTLMYIRKLTGGKKVYTIVGGMHLHNASDERMAGTIQYIKDLDIKYICTGHCTGAGQIHEMYSVFPDKVEHLFVGKILNFELIPELSLNF